MRKLTLLLALVAAGMSATAQDSDSLKMERLSEVVVSGVRAQKNAPYAVNNIRKKELREFSKSGQELPFLFARTPGVTAWSENGVGTGTTYMRIRGAGDSRINVTLDGVPLNSPEDQCVFWANMNSYASLLGSVQIQRGVGTSTNGDGAFGGTIALQTATPLQTPSLEVSASYGSYNTSNVGANFSTGLLWNHLVFDGAYHETNTDGYVHGTSGRSGSYYGGLSWMEENWVLRYKNIGNFEKTGQAWNGVTAGTDDLSLMDGTYGEKTGMKTYKDMYDAGLGRYNTLYEQMVMADWNKFQTDANGNYVTERYQMRNGNYWDKTTDNFWQNHNILTFTANLSEQWSTTASLHYTHGYGYYNQFRPQNKLKKFGINYDGVSKTDFVRKKGLKQDAYGLVWNLNYKTESWDVIAGLSAQQFSGNHFGYVTYVADQGLSDYLLADGDYQYYDSDAEKDDENIFVKAAYRFNEHWQVFGDVQYRHVGYNTTGINDNFYKENGLWANQELNIDKKYDFVNPKAGVTFTSGLHRAYASVAISHREPERNNFTDNYNYPLPVAEQLTDWELGYNLNASDWFVGANLYYMDYTDQFVQTGLKSDIGENLTTNIKDSYRMGIELQASWKTTPWLTIEGNAALSANKIKDFDEYVEDWDDWEDNPDAATYHCDGNGDELRQFHYDNSTLAFSPSTILNGFLNFHWKGLQAVWHTNYVSRQYLDNTENKDRSLPGNSTTSLNLSYTTPLKALKVKEAIFGLNVSNLFNKHYASSGWVYSAIYESGGHTPDNRYYQIGFVPMAGTTVMGSITLRF